MKGFVVGLIALVLSGCVTAGHYDSWQYATVTRIEPVLAKSYSQPICRDVYVPGRVIHRHSPNRSVFFSGTYRSDWGSIRLGTRSYGSRSRSYSTPGYYQRVCENVRPYTTIDHYRVWYILPSGERGMTHTKHDPGHTVRVKGW